MADLRLLERLSGDRRLWSAKRIFQEDRTLPCLIRNGKILSRRIKQRILRRKSGKFSGAFLQKEKQCPGASVLREKFGQSGISDANRPIEGGVPSVGNQGNLDSRPPFFVYQKRPPHRIAYLRHIGSGLVFPEISGHERSVERSVEQPLETENRSSFHVGIFSRARQNGLPARMFLDIVRVRLLPDRILAADVEFAVGESSAYFPLFEGTVGICAADRTEMLVRHGSTASFSRLLGPPLQLRSPERIFIVSKTSRIVRKDRPVFLNVLMYPLPLGSRETVDRTAEKD